MADIQRIYTAPPTLSKFHASDKPIRFIRGPIGSGKTVAMIMELFRRCSEMPPSSDGVRRSRVCITRNTLQQLKSTCLVSIQEWLRPVMKWKVSDSTLTISYTPADGIPVYSEWIMLPLDTPENQQRLLSLELTMGWASEVRELPLEIVQALYSRCGRYPSRANIKADYFYGVIAETNSFSEDSEYFEYLEVDKPNNVGYFVQPSGMDSEAENREFLPARYYEDLIESNDEKWVEQYCYNEIGPSLSGQAVFSKIFSSSFHIKKKLYPDYGRPIVIGLDTGRNPAAVTGQIDSRGRLLIFSSIYSENMGMEQFLTTLLQPHLNARFQSGLYWIAVDPAARQRSQIGEESVLEAIKRMGFSVIIASTNNIAPRLRSVERYMSMQVGGSAGFLIDEEWNGDLIRALQHGYRYKRDKKGALAEVPEKLHPASDLCDGLQYLCLSAGSNVIAKALRGTMRITQKPAVGAWT
jgi:hypothetical protein